MNRKDYKQGERKGNIQEDSKENKKMKGAEKVHIKKSNRFIPEGCKGEITLHYLNSKTAT